MINPFVLTSHEPIDRMKYNLPSRILINILEYIVRNLGAWVLSVALIIVAIVPFRSSTKGFFNILNTISGLYIRRQDGKTNNTKGMEKTDGTEVYGMESKESV